ncbi:60S ribosomal protein L27-1 [Striga hermonthica]|uniref:60S ribosomal protein L27 n=1 Tax=Striga hermonthica TaxID=68872 RepID=A0A9N7R7P3_STRHE|nr:60S ribosomal protein L27-1 [Striga hermonthica]
MIFLISKISFCQKKTIIPSQCALLHVPAFAASSLVPSSPTRAKASDSSPPYLLLRERASCIAVASPFSGMLGSLIRRSTSVLVPDIVTADALVSRDKKVTACKDIKARFEERFKTGKNRWFFSKLRF